MWSLAININRRIPRKWWYVIASGLFTYVISTYVFSHHKLSTLEESAKYKIHSDINQDDTKNEEFKDSDHMPIGRVIDTGNIDAENNKQNKNAQDDDVKDDGEKLQLEVKIPHLLFNGEGLGQKGAAVRINKKDLNPTDQSLYDLGYEHNDFNDYVSNLISVDRSLPDTRDPLCLNQTFPSDLPDTSVIICFLNEAWSVLVRSVHSIINQSPPHLLREIILVDDKSDYDHLKAPLEKYMEKFPKVKIIRNTEREGLIRSRLNGAKVATGQVLTFLDSHIECATGWLSPLLARIKEDSRHVVWPVIPIIDRHTFQYYETLKASDLQTGVFSWRGVFHWERARLEDMETVISPIRSPVMAGGLFSIDREYFYHIGSYDEEMRFWGGENLEMSFRIWMCGGTIEIMPCSNVGHIFRERNVNVKSSNRGALMINTVRTAMVWMDEYKNLYSKVTGVKLENYGDISSRLELREKLNCKDFEWYLTNVYTNVFRPKDALRHGLVHSGHDSSLCLQAPDSDGSLVKVSKCNVMEYRKQLFFTTVDEEIRLLGTCLDAGKSNLIMWSCHKRRGNQLFEYRETDKALFFPPTNKCAQWLEHTDDLELRPCDGNPRQLWTWDPLPVNFLMKSDHA